MMNSYDLFSAMSGADENLVARSDFRVKHQHGFSHLLLIAACFAIIVIGVISHISKPNPNSLSTYPTASTGVNEAIGTESITPEANQPLLLNGSDVGTLNIVQLSHIEDTTKMPDFLMYVNTERYHIAEGSGTYYVYPISSTENMPECQMTLSWQANISAEEAAQQQTVELASLMENVSSPEADSLINGTVIHSSNGSEWDSAKTDVYITSDLQGGVFIFTLKYYQDDTDGHAIWFRDMLQTFEIITADRQVPDWMANLRSAVEDFTSGFLKNDFSDMQDLIAENANIYTYGADVHSEARVLKIQYKVDNDTAPTSAQVSVRHKYAEDDAYDYITMELKYTNGKWQVVWALIER